jgi:hypothetical protein
MRFLRELELKHKKTTEDEINHFFSPRSPSDSLCIYSGFPTYYRLLYIYIRMKKITIKIRNS